MAQQRLGRDEVRVDFDGDADVGERLVAEFGAFTRDEPSLVLFTRPSPSSPADLIESAGMESDQELRDDVRLLGRLLGEVVAQQAGHDTYELVERIRQEAFQGRRIGDSGQLVASLDALAVPDALHVIRAFSYFALLANIAEDVDHARRRRRLKAAGGESPPGTLRHSVERLHAAGLTAARSATLLGGAAVVPVLTAHPTEVRRKTVLDTQRAIAALLEHRDRTRHGRRRRRRLGARPPAADRSRCGRRRCCGCRGCASRDEINDALALLRAVALRPGAANCTTRSLAELDAALARPRTSCSGPCCGWARGSVATATATRS